MPGSHENSLDHTPRESLREGFYFSLMVGAGETYVPAYVLALGLSAELSGLITTLPVGVGAILQILSFRGVRFFNSRKRWVMFCASIQAISLLLMAGLPALGLRSPEFLFACAGLYWTFGFSAGPAWNAWLTSVVPKNEYFHFFAQRGHYTRLGVMLGIVTSGVALYFFHSIWIFTILLSAAAFFRFLSVYSLGCHFEPPADGSVRKTRSLRFILLWLTRAKTTGVITYVFLSSFTIFIAAPFFTPYMLNGLKLGYLEYMGLLVTTFISQIVTYAYLNRFSGQMKIKNMQLIGAIGLIPIPFFWTLSTSYTYLISMQVLGGFFWAHYEFGLSLYLIHKHSVRGRSAILTVNNFFSAGGMILGSLLGAGFLGNFQSELGAYIHVFQLSTVMRVIPLLPLFFILSDEIPRVRLAMRWLGVRPGRGSIVRPIIWPKK